MQSYDKLSTFTILVLGFMVLCLLSVYLAFVVACKIVCHLSWNEVFGLTVEQLVKFDPECDWEKLN